jgi:hypothetical protein
MMGTMLRLPPQIRLNDARKRKFELLASLTPLQVEMLDAASGGGNVFGARPGRASNGVVLITYRSIKVSPRKRVHQYRLVEDGQRVVNAMVAAGWLRFAPTPVEGDGYFWLTDSASRVWDVLGRPPRDVWWSELPGLQSDRPDRLYHAD